MIESPSLASEWYDMLVKVEKAGKEVLEMTRL